MPGEVTLPRPRTRAIASLVDLVAVGLLALAAGSVLGGRPVEVVVGAALVATSVPTYLLEVATGRSLGKALLQLRHTRPEEGPDARPDVGTFLVRWGVKWFVPAMLVVLAPLPWTWAVLWWVADGVPAVIGDRRALHDRVAGTRVWELVTHAS